MYSEIKEMKFDAWRHGLLDISKRNKLMNYRKSKRATLQITSPALFDLYRRLVVDGESLSFRRQIDAGDDLHLTQLFYIMDKMDASVELAEGEVRSDLSASEMNQTLKNLRSKAKLSQEEQGINILYLSFGFLQWRQKPTDPFMLSPLVLVPISLEVESILSPFYMRRLEEDIVVNPTLDFALSSEYGITLPDFDPLTDDIEAFLDQVNLAVTKNGWSVLKETNIGLLSFLKIVMYKDLEKYKERIFATMPFEIVRNDITKMKVDAIVNAANNSLLGGGGVDGAIHRAAGPELLAECRTLGGCETGAAKITKGYNLPSKYVIHTVGPVWQGGQHNEEKLLISCYQTSLELAEEYKCESLAFPLISAGAYGYPKDKAIKVATDTIRDFLLKHDMLVYLVVFDRSSYAISQKLYANIQAFIDDAYIGPDYERSESLRRVDNIRPSMAQPIAEEPKQKAKQEAKKPFFKRKQEKEAIPDAALFEEECALAPSLDKYLDQIDEGFRDMLLRKIDERHMTDAECYKKANIDRKLFNKIKNQADYKPGKPTVVALAIALHLPLEEIREMLMKAGFSFTHSSKFDLIVEYFIAQGNYDIFEINQALFAFDQKLLGSVM